MVVPPENFLFPPWGQKLNFNLYKVYGIQNDKTGHQKIDQKPSDFGHLDQTAKISRFLVNFSAPTFFF